MRRLIRSRKSTRCSAAATTTFLKPANQRVLAYLRALGQGAGAGASTTCRARAQAVELDLRSLAGAVPIEMFGRSLFPRIGERPTCSRWARTRSTGSGCDALARIRLWRERQPAFGRTAAAADGSRPGGRPRRRAHAEQRRHDRRGREGRASGLRQILPARAHRPHQLRRRIRRRDARARARTRRATTPRPSPCRTRCARRIASARRITASGKRAARCGRSSRRRSCTQARAVAVLNADVTGVTPEWLRRAGPARSRSAVRLRRAGVSASSARGPARDATRAAVDARRVRAGRCASRWRRSSAARVDSSRTASNRPVWDSELGRVGIDLWVTAEALANGFRCCQAGLGPRPATSTRTPFGRAVRTGRGSAFACLERHAPIG